MKKVTAFGTAILLASSLMTTSTVFAFGPYDPQKDLAKYINLPLYFVVDDNESDIKDPYGKDLVWYYDIDDANDDFIVHDSQNIYEFHCDLNIDNPYNTFVRKIVIHGEGSGYNLYGLEVGENWERPLQLGMEGAGSGEFFDAYDDVLNMYYSQADTDRYIELTSYKRGDDYVNYKMCPRCGSTNYTEKATEFNSRVCNECEYIWA